MSSMPAAPAPQQLEATIYAAFARVRLSTHAISWSQAQWMDASGDNAEIARIVVGEDEPDRRRSWRRLINDSSWDPCKTFGILEQLNPEGLQYYLPPIMMRILRGIIRLDATTWFVNDLFAAIQRLTAPEYEQVFLADSNGVTTIGQQPKQIWTPQQLDCIAQFTAWLQAQQTK